MEMLKNFVRLRWHKSKSDAGQPKAEGMKKSDKMTINIRKATKKDLPAIHALVRELAVFEESEAAFVASIEEYARDFEEGIFESQVAEAGGEVVGMTLYYMTFSTWKGKMLYLEDFVVKEGFRELGIGQLLFDAFLKTAREKDCKLAKWQVLDWNETALKFYKKNKAIVEKDWWNVKIIF